MERNAASATFLSERVCSGKYRFGSFAVDFQSGELRKSGLLVHTQEQPLQVLRILLARPGEIVTREEFRALLWPAHTFVDFDHGLNAAIKRLRHLLDDDAERPRYIETLPRHGYRFIGSVVQLDIPESDGIDHYGPTPSAGPTTQAGEATGDFSARRFRRKARAALAILSIALALLLTGVLESHYRASSGKVMLAVLPLANLGDPPGRLFADGMTQELITQLGKTNPSGIGVIAHTSVEQYKHNTQSISQIAKELAVDYVLEGSVRADGQQVRISIQLIRVRNQTQLWAEEYDSVLGNGLGLQSRVAAEAVQQVGTRLSQEHRSPTN